MALVLAKKFCLREIRTFSTLLLDTMAECFQYCMENCLKNIITMSTAFAPRGDSVVCIALFHTDSDELLHRNITVDGMYIHHYIPEKKRQVKKVNWECDCHGLLGFTRNYPRQRFSKLSNDKWRLIICNREHLS